MTETHNATAADAELILRLYDLRREPEMRKARNWIGAEFWPQTFADFQSIAMAFGTQENAYFRQVLSYWDMACSLVAHGALNLGLFVDTGGEALFVYAKIKPFLAEARTALNRPDYLANFEKVMEGTPESRDRLIRVQQNIARLLQGLQQKKTQQSAG
jgi:hypothetical protein